MLRRAGEAERQLSAERAYREQDKVLHAEAMQRIEQLTAAADAMKGELERERETRHQMEKESQRRFEALESRAKAAEERAGRAEHVARLRADESEQLKQAGEAEMRVRTSELHARRAEEAAQDADRRLREAQSRSSELEAEARRLGSGRRGILGRLGIGQGEADPDQSAAEPADGDKRSEEAK
jgi:chromosome segregation ATPase